MNNPLCLRLYYGAHRSHVTRFFFVFCCCPGNLILLLTERVPSHTPQDKKVNVIHMVRTYCPRVCVVRSLFDTMFKSLPRKNPRYVKLVTLCTS